MAAPVVSNRRGKKKTDGGAVSRSWVINSFESTPRIPVSGSDALRLIPYAVLHERTEHLALRLSLPATRRTCKSGCPATMLKSHSKPFLLQMTSFKKRLAQRGDDDSWGEEGGRGGAGDKATKVKTARMAEHTRQRIVPGGEERVVSRERAETKRQSIQAGRVPRWRW
ncbi:hypothetical protein B0H13DRAFT_1885617 [Mycena leptocephala]|nr:hypothetical protein B0H13DRAFT_1885617 [Mycena leptocephala]